ncbi:hypothetical protein N431DRAFT_431125, partial [Stipitochalara longipes BDJ]
MNLSCGRICILLLGLLFLAVVEAEKLYLTTQSRYVLSSFSTLFSCGYRVVVRVLL